MGGNKVKRASGRLVEFEKLKHIGLHVRGVRKEQRLAWVKDIFVSITTTLGIVLACNGYDVANAEVLNLRPGDPQLCTFSLSS